MSESVHHPAHYGGDTTYETIKVIEAWGLNFHLGNSVKYISRAGKKTGDSLEDLRKARWYLNRYIELAERACAVNLSPAGARARSKRSRKIRKAGHTSPHTHRIS